MSLFGSLVKVGFTPVIWKEWWPVPTTALWEVSPVIEKDHYYFTKLLQSAGRKMTSEDDLKSGTSVTSCGRFDE